MESGTILQQSDGQVDLENADYLGIGTLEILCEMRDTMEKRMFVLFISKWRTESVLQEH